MAFENPFINTLSRTAGQFGTTGQTDIGKVSDFYRTLLGGSRQAITQQASPAANMARDAADAAKREMASRGTARTGGTAAQNQQVEDEVRRQMDTLIGQQQAQAAQGLKSVSDSELNTMMNSLGIGASTVQSDINSRRAASAAMWSALIGGAADVATGGIAALGQMGKGGGGGGGGGVQAPTFNPIPIGSTPTMAPLPANMDPTVARALGILNQPDISSMTFGNTGLQPLF